MRTLPQILSKRTSLAHIQNALKPTKSESKDLMTIHKTTKLTHKEFG